MYAQLFYISEEGNHYPQTDRLQIDDSLENCLLIPKEHEGNNAYWEYYTLSDRENSLQGGWHITDNNSAI
jgi:hypothetical protein